MYMFTSYNPPDGTLIPPSGTYTDSKDTEIKIVITILLIIYFYFSFLSFYSL